MVGEAIFVGAVGWSEQPSAALRTALQKTTERVRIRMVLSNLRCRGGERRSAFLSHCFVARGAMIPLDANVIASARPRVVHSAPRVVYFALRSTVARVRAFVVCLAALSVVGAAGQSTKIDTSAIGPKVGQPVPDFSGTDQFGKRHTRASSMGAKGAMLVFFRSADW
jgi:hypothetical protein